MGYSNFLFLKEELSLIAVMLILLVYDLFGSQKSLKYFHPVACVLFLAHTLLNLFPAGTAEAFGGMYVCTPIGSIVKTILNTGTLIVLLQAYNWVNSESVLIRRGEFYLILFSSLLGMYFMISAGNFLLFFIGLETASIPMAVLSAFDKYKPQSAEAGIVALRYFPDLRDGRHTLFCRHTGRHFRESAPIYGLRIFYRGIVF